MFTGQHIAPGFGDLIGGWYVVPQNPIAGGGRAGYVPSLGELMPGSYPVPQNPLNRGLAAVGAAGPGMGCGCGSSGGSESHAGHSHSGGGGCGCGGSCGGGGGCSQQSPWSAFRGLSGMGFLGMDELGGSEGISPVWLVGGALAAYLLLSSPKRYERRAQEAEAKAQYARKRAKIRRSYSYRARVGDALSAGRDAYLAA